MADFDPNDPSLPAHLRREMHAIPEAAAIFGCLLAPESHRVMMAAADAGRPPITAVSNVLAREFGNAVLTHRVKRFVGMAVAWVMRREGFEVLGQPVPLKNDPVFRSGTRFARRPTGGDGGDGAVSDLLRRVVSSLRPRELVALATLVRAELDRRPAP